MNRNLSPLRPALAGLVLLLIAGLSSPAQSGQPATGIAPLIVDRPYPEEPARVWTAVETVIREGGGRLRLADRDSGLMFYSLPAAPPSSLVYVNLYLEPEPGGGTRVYFVAHNWDGRCLDPVEQDFFGRLEQRLAGGGHGDR
jgi:hypothetical protein